MKIKMISNNKIIIKNMLLENKNHKNNNKNRTNKVMIFKNIFKNKKFTYRNCKKRETNSKIYKIKMKIIIQVSNTIIILLQKIISKKKNYFIFIYIKNIHFFY